MKKGSQRGPTLPRLLRDQAAARGLLPAIREKSFGIWNTLSWQGAVAVGRRHGQRLGRTRLHRR